MKKRYMKPAMQVIRMQHTQMLCDSANAYDGYNNQNIPMPAGEITEESLIW